MMDKRSIIKDKSKLGKVSLGVFREIIKYSGVSKLSVR